VIILDRTDIEKRVKGVNGIDALAASRLSQRPSIRCYRRQVTPEQARTLLQAHSEGSSLRGVSRTSGLAYGTVVSIIRASSTKGQLVHNQAVQAVETEASGADEFWSFVKKNRSSVKRKNSKLETVGLH